MKHFNYVIYDTEFIKLSNELKQKIINNFEYIKTELKQYILRKRKCQTTLKYYRENEQFRNRIKTKLKNRYTHDINFRENAIKRATNYNNDNKDLILLRAREHYYKNREFIKNKYATDKDYRLKIIQKVKERQNAKKALLVNAHDKTNIFICA